MTFPPDCYLIGAQKSGTTTLAYLLSKHPNICVAKTKEPHFFTTYWDKGLDWYQTQFSNYQDAVCVDASTTYSMAPLSTNNSRNVKEYLQGVPQKLYSVNPEAKFIYLLRNPVERTYSAYWHYVTKGREFQSFRKAIRNDSFYLDVSNYYGQLSLWLKYFPIESFLFVLFEDLKRQPLKVAKECFEYIGVESDNVQLDLEEAKNKTRYVNGVGRYFNGLTSSLDHSELGFLVPYQLRKVVSRLTTDSNQKIPKMQGKDRGFLQEYFSEDIYNLELLTGLSLSHWQA